MFPITFNAIGDIIALVQLGIGVVTVLKGSRSAKQQYDELKGQLVLFLSALYVCKLDIESLNQVHQKIVNDLLSRAYEQIADALVKLADFRLLDTETRGRSHVRTLWQSIIWELRASEDMPACLAKIAETMATLNLALTAANGAHANGQFETISTALTGLDALRDVLSMVEGMRSTLTSIHEDVAGGAAADAALAAVVMQTARDISALRTELSLHHAAQHASMSTIQCQVEDVLRMGDAQHRDTLLMQELLKDFINGLEQRGTTRQMSSSTWLLPGHGHLRITASAAVTRLSSALVLAPLPRGELAAGCIGVLAAVIAAVRTRARLVASASRACLLSFIAHIPNLYKTPTVIHVVFIIDYFNDCSPLELPIEDAKSLTTLHAALLRHFYGKYGYTITLKRMYNVVIKDNAADAGQPLPGSKSWAGLVRAGQRLFLDAIVRQESEEAGVQLSCPSCGKPQPAGCMEAQRLMKCAVCPVSFGQVEQADFTPITGDNTPSFSEIDRVASLEDELNRCKRIMVLASQRLQLRTEDQGVEQEPESRALRSVWVSYGGGGVGGVGMPQGYIHGLSNYYSGSQLSPQTYIQYYMELVDGNTYNATVWLRNFKPPAYYVGRGSSAMAAKESAAHIAGRALGLW